MKRFLPSILWSALILWLSANPGINLPSSWLDFIQLDKLAHLFVYGVQTYLILWAFKANSMGKGFVIAIAISAIFGISMELMQYLFFPNRFFEVPDIIANIIGSFTGLYAFKYFNY